MGYFSRLDCAAQSGVSLSAPAPREADVPAQPEIQTVADLAADLAADPAAEQARPKEGPAPAPIPLDAPASAVPDDAAARQAHEAAEAQRKAEWDAKQREKQAAEQGRLDHLSAMSDEDVVAASTQRVRADTEKLTRRSMKESVSEHIQALCRQDPAFARKAMHPRKSMMHCFWYINRKAKEFMEQEIKAANPNPASGVYGDDIPDDLVYQWAVDYFNDLEAQEDKEKDEKFTPRPYVPKSSGSKPAAKPKAKKETPKKEPKPKPAPKPKENAGVDGQLSFMGAAG